MRKGKKVKQKVIQYIGRADYYLFRYGKEIYKSCIKRLPKLEKTYELLTKERQRIDEEIQKEYLRISQLEYDVDNLKFKAKWKREAIQEEEKRLKKIEKAERLRDYARATLKPPVLSREDSDLIDWIENTDPLFWKERSTKAIEEYQEDVDLYEDERKVLYRERAKIRRREKKKDKIWDSLRKLEVQMDEIKFLIGYLEKRKNL